MEANEMNVPYIVYEGTQARNERIVRRLIITVIIAIAMLFASNAIWLWAWMQYDYTMEVQQVDLDSGDGGVNNFIGRDMSGDINNAENESDEDSNYSETKDQ